MSKDYKIGIIVGLAVLILGVVFVIVTADEEELPPVAADTEEAEKVAIEPVVGEEPASTDSEETALDWNLTEPSPATAEDDTEADEVREPVAPVGDEGAGEYARIRFADPDSEDDSSAAVDDASEESAGTEPRVGESGGTYFQLVPDHSEILQEDDPAPSTDSAEEPRAFTPVQPPATTPETPPASRPRLRLSEPRTTSPSVSLRRSGTYVVQEGDSYSLIARKVWGSGMEQYWQRIADANPDVAPRALRPDMVLSIPDRPDATAASARAPSGRRGSVTTDARGNRVYVVSEDDTTGLWGIAKKLYGKGTLYTVLQEANPDINPRALRAGMMLQYPPAPADGAAPSAVRTPGSATDTTGQRHGTTFVRNGIRYYVVKSGDAGFWGIAKNMYGRGSYASVLRDANPGVDSTALQPGDLVIAPSNVPAAGSGSRRTEATPRRSPASESEFPQPDFSR